MNASTRITAKGQITLPASIRMAMGVSVGDSVEFLLNAEGQVLVRPLTGTLEGLVGLVRSDRKIKTVEEMDRGIAAAVSEEHANSSHTNPRRKGRSAA